MSQFFISLVHSYSILQYFNDTHCVELIKGLHNTCLWKNNLHTKKFRLGHQCVECESIIIAGGNFSDAHRFRSGSSCYSLHTYVCEYV